MFRIEMLPACEGDCLILGWGDEEQPRRILIDGGRKSTARAVLDYAEQHKLGPGAFERFVITHIDQDHIEGAVALLKQPEFRALVKQVWFNGRADLDYAEPETEYEMFGAKDGERLTTLIKTNDLRWNTDFGEKPVAVVDEDDFPVIELEGGLRLTIVSPDLGQLEALAKPWDEDIEKAPPGWETLGEDQPVEAALLAAKKFSSDRAKPNGSSIALIAEYEGRAVLLTGDAHVGRLIKSITAIKEDRADLAFAAVKASHHGSRGNTSVELVRLLDCPLWLFSTNGDKFSHPDQEAVARVICETSTPADLVFNYETRFNRVWKNGTKPERDFTHRFGDGSIAVDIP